MKVYMVYSGTYHQQLIESGCSIVVSYGLKTSLPAGFHDYLIDSGGYQSKNGTAKRLLLVERYANWLMDILTEYGNKISGYISLDIKNAEESFKNYQYLRSLGLSPIPVWKADSPVKHLDYYADKSQIIAIGGVNSKGSISNQALFRFVTNRHLDNLYHMLGIGTGITSFKVFPYSIDCSSWLNPAKFGHQILFDEKEIVRDVVMPNSLQERIKNNRELEKELVKIAIRNLMKLEDVTRA